MKILLLIRLLNHVFRRKKINDRFYNIFISDEENKFQNVISTKENNNNLIILAKEGFISQKNLCYLMVEYNLFLVITIR